MVGQLAAECQASGIQVLGINPGPFRSPLRSQVYIAENPAALPAPTQAAERIIKLLTGEMQAPGVFLDLAELDSSDGQ
jgi:NAD(P)-dependent dehydrogenase (short-subunit alcohol dehydrogenase family)